MASYRQASDPFWSSQLSAGMALRPSLQQSFPNDAERGADSDGGGRGAGRPQVNGGHSVNRSDASKNRGVKYIPTPFPEPAPLLQSPASPYS